MGHISVLIWVTATAFLTLKKQKMRLERPDPKEYQPSAPLISTSSLQTLQAQDPSKWDLLLCCSTLHYMAILMFFPLGLLALRKEKPFVPLIAAEKGEFRKMLFIMQR